MGVQGGNFSIHDGDDGTNQVRIDNMGSALQAIEFEHHEIHDGDMYVAWTLDESIGTGDGSDLVLAFKTNSDAATTIYKHMQVSWACKAAAHLDIVEAPTWTAQTGSDVVIYNRERNSGNTTTVLQNESDAAFTDYNSMIKNPASFAGGTIIWQDYSFAGKKDDSDRSRQGNEIVLKANTTYGIRVVPDAADNGVFLRTNFYELENR